MRQQPADVDRSLKLGLEIEPEPKPSSAHPKVQPKRPQTESHQQAPPHPPKPSPPMSKSILKNENYIDEQKEKKVRFELPSEYTKKYHELIP